LEIRNKVCVVTGAASGIGRAMAKRFAAAGARGIVVADIQKGPLKSVADEIGGHAVSGDMTSEADVQALIKTAEDKFGDIDIFCSNAGIIRLGGEDAPNDEWQLCWDLHLMAHVYAARDLAPKMAARGDGYLVNTASAAGLLSHVNSATYTVTKHAAVAFAEWISINYGNQGVKVSVLCPQAVKTAMTEGREGGAAHVDGMITPEALAESVIDTTAREEFLILPHAEVLDYMRRKTEDYGRWLGGMRKFKERFPEGI